VTEANELVQIHLFVIGSFGAGMVHRAKIQNYISCSMSARAQAKCYMLPVGYPVLVEAEGQDLVTGELVTLNAPRLFFHLLDEFQGVSANFPEKGLHLKRQLTVQTDQGPTVVTCYFMNPTKLPREAILVPDGDWQSAMAKGAPRTVDLTQKHIEYLRKLGQIKGRGAMPYDLNLSRELMKMDMIVDKGRRLALSKLGKDVIRYLPE